MLHKKRNYRLMMVIGLSFIMYHLSFIPAGAQTFTDRIQKKAEGKGTITIHEDAAIDELVNGVNTQGQQVQGKNVQKYAPAGATGTDEKQPTVRTNYRGMGYRIQVYAGGGNRNERMKTERIRNSLRTQFPGEAVYVHFKSPRWICRMGNYRTIEEAHKMLQAVKRMGYNEATIVKGTINSQSK